MIHTRLLLGVVMCWALTGCAVHYSDSKTGAEHIWGFGHLAVKATVPDDGKKAIVRSVTLFGAALGFRDGSPLLSIGWEELQRVEVMDGNTAVLIEGPRNDFLELKFGGAPASAALSAKEQP